MKQVKKKIYQPGNIDYCYSILNNGQCHIHGSNFAFYWFIEHVLLLQKLVNYNMFIFKFLVKFGVDAKCPHKNN